jgi:hypothetical protein
MPNNPEKFYHATADAPEHGRKQVAFKAWHADSADERQDEEDQQEPILEIHSCLILFHPVFHPRYPRATAWNADSGCTAKSPVRIPKSPFASTLSGG